MENIYKIEGLNTDYLIDTFENYDIINIKGVIDSGWSESINAYFGKRNNNK